MAAGGRTRGGVCRRGPGVAEIGGALRVLRLWPGLGGGGGGGDGVGAALLVVWGTGVGVVLDGSLGVPQGSMGVVTACRAVLVVPGWLRCPGTGRRLLPGHPGGAVAHR